MQPAPIPQNEDGRLAELSHYAIQSTPREIEFDRITELASYFFHCPIAVLSFVDGQHEWVKSCVGADFGDVKRTESFGAWAILNSEVLVASDTAADPRFSDNPIGARFYAGAPLLSPRGFALGALSILSTEPRPEGFTMAEQTALEKLAAMAMSALEARQARRADLVRQFDDGPRSLLKTTLASIGDGVIVTDVASKITFLNPVAEQITGWKLEEALARPIQEIFPIVNETSREAVTNPITKALAGQRAVVLENHTILLTRDGREVPIDDSAAPIFAEDAIAGAVLVFRDVAKRRMAERALEFSENQFRKTFASSPLGQVLTRTDGTFIEANEAYRRITGFSAGELSSVSFISLTHPDEIENNRVLFRRLVDGEIESYVLEKRIFTKGHVLRWVRAHASLLHSGRTVSVIGLIEDITDRKAAEQRFRFLAETIPQMVWTATPDGMLDYVNTIGVQYFQLSEQALMGAGWLAGVHPQDRQAAVDRWTHSLQTGETYETQFRLLRGSDASWRIHLVRALPLRGEDGSISHWFGTCTDIENQHHAAQLVEQDRHRWRELLLQTPAAVALLRGPHHRFEWANSAYSTLVDQSQEVLAGKTVREVLPEFESQAYIGLLNRVYETGQPVAGRESLVRLERGDVYVNFVYLPTKAADGQIDGIFVHVTDVTDMVNARRAVEDSERQFRTLAETIPHLAWMADPTGSIFWYNRRWFDYTGTTLDEMQGWGWQSVHDPAVLPEVLAGWKGAIAAGEIFEMVFPLRGADGTFRAFLTRVVPIKDNAGLVTRWFGTNTDITDQRKIEEQLRRVNRDLEEFSYLASHDLQEPLRMVNIYTQLMLKRQGISQEDLERFSGFVLQGVKRMQTLIQDLLSFSQSVHAEEGATIGTADLSVALEEAISVLKSRIDETGATITVQPLPVTRGNTSQMAHVFQNVISNALKYRKPAEVPRIHISVKREKDMAVVSVSDNGIGFEPQHAERIFGIFKRLHKDEYPGTGLGLSICKRIVERYGGQMWATSVEGQGSTFCFSLPVELGT